MEDLYCSEAPACSEGPIALQDNTLLEDSRILNNLLQLQPFTIPPQNYFLHIQSDIQPYMRKAVTKWMWEVCEEEGCEEQVFAVAINLLDRFLCACVIQRTQLQLLGSVCLLLASKLRQCRPLSVDNLTFYTDYSVSQQEIRSWELLLVSKLGWDLAPITAFDFVDHLLCRVPFLGCDPAVTRKHATTFLALAVIEPEFLQVEPSALAVASIISAVRGLIPLSECTAALTTFAAAVNLDPHALHALVNQVDLVVEREAMLVPSPVSTQQTQQPLTPTNKQQPPEPMEFFDVQKTPTEVTDIHF
ncbi:hypothetical protein O3P69_009048 [Scylla paramamosain]|uniref:Uncharacterized protein n=1 Tax=Scylla paramamosain TaxID=85552 RepID=A0AAW0TSW5_SCYPA